MASPGNPSDPLSGTGPTQQVGQPSLIVGVVQHLERPPEKPIGCPVAPAIP